MRIAVTGSVATDHLMSFPGRFSDSLVAEHLDRVSLSFLVDDLEVRPGGCAANISVGLARLGLRPVLLAAIGADGADYRAAMAAEGVDCDSVHVSQTLHTARFTCTTDTVQAQMASFYPGAMAEAGDVDLDAAQHRTGGFDLVLISPNDPATMVATTQWCRDNAVDFAADPSQQLSWATPDWIRDLIDGAAYLFANEYELALIEKKAGWTPADVIARVGTSITTLGERGVRIARSGDSPVEVPAVPTDTIVDPTGVGDAFRAGFLAASSWGLGAERSAQVGCALASQVLNASGPQEYEVRADTLLTTLRDTYRSEAADEVEAATKAAQLTLRTR